jgi:phenylacetic acid degradation operon negative regulatory protein
MAADARKLPAKLGVLAATVFQGPLTGEGREYGAPTDAWDLGHVAAVYRNFLSETEPLADASALSSVSPVEALIVRTELIDVWRAFPNVNPDLPWTCCRETGLEQGRAKSSSSFTGASPSQRAPM